MIDAFLVAGQVSSRHLLCYNLNGVVVRYAANPKVPASNPWSLMDVMDGLALD
jgi:hypothetical protein